MKNDVRYNNDLNAVPLKDFSGTDMDMFWAVCQKMKLKGTKQETFTFTEIKDLISYGNKKRGKRFFFDLIDMSNHLADLKIARLEGGIYDRLNLFQRFTINEDEQTLTVKVSEDFEYILNSIGTDFTLFNLDNMTSLRSPYVKELYRQLMRHKNKETGAGVWFVTVEDFYKILAIPKSYRLSNVNTRIFQKAKEEFLGLDKNDNPIPRKPELEDLLFDSFDVERIRGKHGKRANEVSSFAIRFKEHRSERTLKIVEALEETR